MYEDLNKKLLKRLGRAFIILLILILIVLGLRFGVPYIRYKIYNTLEAKENTNIMLKNDFCILRFELNDSTIISVDKDMIDGCVSQLDFDETHLHITSHSIRLKARYEVTGKYQIKIFDSENTRILKNSEYSISLTKRGINILGDNITIIADKMKN